MGRARVWVAEDRDAGSMRIRNVFIHEILPEFLQQFRNFGRRRVTPFVCVILIFFWFWNFGWVLIRVSVSRSSALSLSTDVGIAYWTWIFLRWWRWSCLMSSTKRNDVEEGQWRKNSLTSQDHDRNVVLHIALNLNTIFNETWFSTIGPLIWISVILAELSERKHCVSSRIFTVRNMSNSLT